MSSSQLTGETEPIVIHNIIWDAGGTLFDTYPGMVQSFACALHEHGVHIPETRILELARQSTQDAITTLAREGALEVTAFEAAFRRRYNAVIPENQLPFPGVIEVLAAICAQGGQNLIVTHRRRDSLDALLDAHNMRAYFSDRITAEDPFPRKPDPAALNEMVKRHALDRATTLLIGDRALDLDAGRAAGLRTCLFESGPLDEPYPQADLRITAFATLLALLHQSPPLNHKAQR
ncbi:MAG: HAD-IA family hydrolase [Anaerolineae bacterium]|jgi:HAD superfamily hydrolase (TIGR01509 family)|nr:HAD-IA family hydrolase [Anaerolineae bacterium]